MKRSLCPIQPTAVLVFAFAVMAVLAMGLVPHVALADTADDIYGTTIDKADFYDDGTSSTTADTSTGDVLSVQSEDGSDAQLTAQSISLTPLYLSGRMLYYAKWESGQNYDQGLSYGDGYHAMGYFQFDNRYGLGEFLEACYQYNPSTYSMFAQFESVDLSSATLHDSNGLTDLGNRLNAAWHAAYAANPTEFSQLQNDYAYQTYYTSAANYMASLGIDLNAKPDYVRGLCWGMCNLFGSSGWRKFVTSAGINSTYDGQTIAYLLTSSVINNVSSIYPSQSIYWSGWINRYTDERETCLDYGYDDADGWASIISDTVLPAGTYVFESSKSTAASLDVSGGSSDDGANVQTWTSNGSDAQKWVVTEGSDGYCTISNVGSGKVLDVSGGVACAGTNVQQWSANSSRAQKWIAAPNSDGTYTFHSALGADLVVDLANGTTTDGTNAWLYSSNGTAAQRFVCVSGTTKQENAFSTSEILEPGTYTVRSGLDSSKVLDVTGGSTDAGANVQLWSANGTDAQVWDVSIDSDGYVTLTNAKSDKALDVTNAAAVSGTNVEQWDQLDNSAQKWIPVANSDGTITLWSALGNNQVLDVTGGFTADGTNVETWTSNSSAAQRFTFAAAESSEELAIPEGSYVLSSLVGNSQVLEDAGGSLDSGSNIQNWSNNGTYAQHWYVRASSTGYTIQNVKSGMYLTVAGDNVVQSYYAGSTSQWSFESPDASTSDTTIRNVGTGRVLDVAGGSTQSGANVQAYVSNGTTAQQWSFSACDLMSAGTYEFAPAKSTDLRLDVDGGLSDDGANVQIWTANGSSAQRWTVTSAGSGYYAIASVASGKVLDIAGGSSSAGTNVQQWGSNGTNAQRWRFVMGPEGVIIQSALGTVLDVQGGGTTDGTNVWAYDSNGTRAQAWRPIAA